MPIGKYFSGFLLIVWGHGIQVERLLFFKDKVWEEVKFLYEIWKNKVFIKGEEVFEEEIDIYDNKRPVLYNNGRIFDDYRPTNFVLNIYGIKWRRVNEYYRDWREYQEDKFKINKRYVGLLFRDVVL